MERKDMRGSGKAFSMLITFCVALMFWVLLSAWNIYLIGHYDLFRLIRGIIVALIVTITVHELFISEQAEKVFLKFQRWLRYITWEIWQIILAAIDVAARVLGLRPIDPRIIEFETTLRSDRALTTFADSITLTPGTITIYVEPETGKYTVHAISKEPADALTVDQTMQRKVGYVFMEEG
ncbi:MAG: protein MnhE [Methanophagales archaeon ANME-1-THS]|nr:MAG: protein MnhE [Methanophagales archaeon ANME-1-THS]